MAVLRGRRGLLALNVAYSFKLKHIAYLDVGCIAAGFVLRVMGGGSQRRISVSHYLLVCTALLALFLGFGKRRHELAVAALGGSGKTRAALESYTARGIDVALTVTALATIATYVAYTLDPRTQEFFKTRWLWPGAGARSGASCTWCAVARAPRAPPRKC